MFKSPDEYYQAIAEELVEIIKEPWNSVEVEAIRFTDSIDTSVKYTRPDGSKESRVRTIMLPDYFYNLADVISNKEKGLYKKCIFKLSSDGKFKADFEYE